jgi:hypothetical protein
MASGRFLLVFLRREDVLWKFGRVSRWLAPLVKIPEPEAYIISGQHLPARMEVSAIVL